MVCTEVLTSLESWGSRNSSEGVNVPILSTLSNQYARGAPARGVTKETALKYIYIFYLEDVILP